MAMTIYDISKKAGVSIATVSRVLNGSENVRPSTRKKVMDVIDKYDYTPNAFARGMGLHSLKTIGILCADSSDLFLAKAVYFLEQELQANGYESLLCCTGYNLDIKKNYLNLILSKKVDSIILVGSNFIGSTEDENQYIKDVSTQVPIMLLNASFDYPNVYSTLCDDYGTMFEATAEMIQAGITDILYLYDSKSYSGLKKLHGFRDAMKEHNIPGFEKLIHFYDGNIEHLDEIADFVADIAKKGASFHVTDVVDAYGEYEKYAAYAKLDTLRFIVSNTTEAGIVYDDTDKIELNPPKSYPGKLTKFLYERYRHFNGAADKGLVMLPVELIDDNGIHLKECVLKLAALWNLEEGFTNWVNEACVFTSTLVDRIVTGYPRDEAEELCKEFGYQDNLIVTGEPFALWVIESAKDISEEFPLPKAGLPVIFTDNQKPYKQRKVRILNGAHTSFVLASYLAGNDIVLESMQDELIFNFMKKTIFEEVIPTLTLPKQDLIDFANAVITRFNNPYVKHALLSISLNSVSKWRARCMPSFLGYIEKEGKLPEHLTFSLAALMAFYTGTEIRDKALIGHRGEQEYNILDDAAVLEFFAANSSKEPREFAHAVLSNEDFWGEDLSSLAGVEDAVASYLTEIRASGMRKAMEKIFA